MSRSGKFIRVAASVTVGFLMGFFLMFDCTRVSSRVTDVMELVLRLPSYGLLLIPELVTNHLLSWTEISLAVGGAWGIIFGVATLLWLKKEDGVGMRLLRAYSGVAVVMAFSVAACVVGCILSFPFGCLIAPNLDSIDCPSAATIASETGIVFPSGTRLIYSDSSSHPGDYDGAAVLALSKQGISTIRNSIRMHPAKASEFPRPEEGRPWFDPSARSGLECAGLQRRRENGSTYVVEGRIWLAEDKSGGGILYLSYCGYH